MGTETTQRQNVVLTGAGDSVGRVIAEAFLSRGNKVHIADIREEAVAATLEANPKMHGTVADTGKVEDVEKLFQKALGWMGNVDVLIYCVGIGGPRACVEDISFAQWDEVITANLNGFFFCVKQVVPEMKKRRHGAIVAFSSVSSRTAVPLRSPYVASKAGLEGLTRCLARELGPSGIRCNAILPGPINNARLQRVLQRNADARRISVEEVEAEVLAYVSLGRKIEMREFADLVLYLTSEKGRSITGQLIELGGNVEWEDS